MSRPSTAKQIITVLLPSQTELIVGLFLVAGLFFYLLSPFLYNTYAQEYFAGVKQTYSTENSTYNQVSAQINSNEYIANATVFSLWAVVGLLLYYLVYYFTRSEHYFSMFLDRLKSGRSDVKTELEETFIRSSIRAGALMLFLLLLPIFLQRVLPYAIVQLDISSTSSFWDSLGVVGLGFLAIITALHVLVILARCLLLRQRVFLG